MECDDEIRDFHNISTYDFTGVYSYSELISKAKHFLDENRFACAEVMLHMARIAANNPSWDGADDEGNCAVADDEMMAYIYIEYV